jgi:hypothetical protein
LSEAQRLFATAVDLACSEVRPVPGSLEHTIIVTGYVCFSDEHAATGPDHQHHRAGNQCHDADGDACTGADRRRCEIFLRRACATCGAERNQEDRASQRLAGHYGLPASQLLTIPIADVLLAQPVLMPSIEAPDGLHRNHLSRVFVPNAGGTRRFLSAVTRLTKMQAAGCSQRPAFEDQLL